MRQLRKSKGMTQDEVSARLDYSISRSTLSNYEIGRRTPHLSDLQRLAAIFGVGLDYFNITRKDEAFDLLQRAKEVFESPFIPAADKENLYREFMKLYLDIEPVQDAPIAKPKNLN